MRSPSRLLSGICSSTPRWAGAFFSSAADGKSRASAASTPIEYGSDVSRRPVSSGALAGVLYAGAQGAADPVSGVTYQLPAFAAAFLGSTCIAPGRFNPWGATVAVYFLVTGITGLVFLGFSSFIQEMFYGGALVIAVTLSQLVRGRQEQQF
jgi:predicted ABC-type sugar transport system permease subunit